MQHKIIIFHHSTSIATHRPSSIITNPSSITHHPVSSSSSIQYESTIITSHHCHHPQLSSSPTPSILNIRHAPPSRIIINHPLSAIRRPSSINHHHPSYIICHPPSISIIGIISFRRPYSSVVHHHIPKVHHHPSLSPHIIIHRHTHYQSSTIIMQYMFYPSLSIHHQSSVQPHPSPSTHTSSSSIQHPFAHIIPHPSSYIIHPPQSTHHQYTSPLFHLSSSIPPSLFIHRRPSTIHYRPSS